MTTVLFPDTANWILAALGAYLVLIILVGLYYSKRIEVCDDHVLCDRNLEFPYLVASVTATWLCAGALMGAAGYAYLGGMQAVIFDPWSPWLTMMLVGMFFAYRLRKTRHTTVVDLMGARYGRSMEIIYLFMQVLGGIAWVAGQMVALGIVINMTTGFSLEWSIVIGTAAIIIATYSGGLYALTRLDTFALIIIAVGLFLLFPPVMEAVGGWTNFVNTAQVAWDIPAFSMTIEPPPRGYLWYTGMAGISLYIGAWLGVGLGDITCTILLQRALAAKSEKTAVTGFMTAGFLYLFLAMVPVMIGIAVYTYGIRVRQDMAEYVLMWATSNFLPGAAGVIFVVGIGAAILSTCGDTILVKSTLIGHNIYRYFKPDANTKETLKMVRIFIPIVAIIALMIAIYFTAVYRLIIFAGAVLMPTVVAPYIAAFYWKGANTIGAVWSFITGTVSWVIVFILLLPMTIQANMGLIEYGEPWMQEAIWDALFIAVIPGFIVAIITLVLVSRATSDKDPPKSLTTPEGQDVSELPFLFWVKRKGKSDQPKDKEVGQ